MFMIRPKKVIKCSFIIYLKILYNPSVKNTYLSIISPKEENLTELLQKNLSDIEIELAQDGLIVFKTSLEPKIFTKIEPSIKTFFLIKRFDNLEGNYFKPIFQWAGRHSLEQISDINKYFGFKSFRIVLKDKKKTLSGHRRAIKALENKISKETNLAVNRVNPDTEIWIVHTSQGYGFIIFKITK